MTRRNRTEKLDLYAKYVVAGHWIVDPATEVFEFLLLNDLPVKTDAVSSGNSRRSLIDLNYSHIR